MLKAWNRDGTTGALGAWLHETELGSD